MTAPITTKFIEDILFTINNVAHLKDAKTGVYINTNEPHLKIFGMDKPEQMIGSNIWDLSTVMSPEWRENALQMEEFEAEAYHTAKPVVRKNRIWLNANGLVWQHNMSKIPVTGANNKISMIFTTGEDLTKEMSLDELYRQYQIFYPNKKERVNKFLIHVGLRSHFSDLPTDAETLVLIAKKMFVSNKLIAQRLNIGLGTVESHTNKLMQKTPDLTKAILEMRIR
jgi:hypothetical protein